MWARMGVPQRRQHLVAAQRPQVAGPLHLEALEQEPGHIAGVGSNAVTPHRRRLHCGRRGPPGAGPREFTYAAIQSVRAGRFAQASRTRDGTQLIQAEVVGSGFPFRARPDSTTRMRGPWGAGLRWWLMTLCRDRIGSDLPDTRGGGRVCSSRGTAFWAVQGARA
jgi:hypothetical protein